MSPDELIAEELASNPHVRGLAIRVTREDGQVKISGRTFTFFQKQVVIAICRKHMGDKPFRLELAVEGRVR